MNRKPPDVPLQFVQIGRWPLGDDEVAACAVLFEAFSLVANHLAIVAAKTPEIREVAEVVGADAVAGLHFGKEILMGHTGLCA